ncbi:pulmonary surfactant-associated protein D-like [Ammospiza nelsoni]|uniref:pulmonary surfactant-associated protein D-like n=1 Tax=Ammospiza nelsoni TaxID=2857394 RepID=UPI00286A00A4|nr:pulmonary surfactant-associated protein D-like [Ammospiza nelsoni]
MPRFPSRCRIPALGWSPAPPRPPLRVGQPTAAPPSSTMEAARKARKGAMAPPSGDCQLQWSISAVPYLSAAQRPPSRGGRGSAGEAGGNVYKQDRGVEGPGGGRGAEPAVGAAAEPMGARGARRKGGGGARGTFSARRPPGLAGARGQ